MNREMNDKSRGQVREPIFKFIRMENVIVDPLHMFLRISDRLIDALVKDIEVMDATFSTSLYNNTNLKKLVVE